MAESEIVRTRDDVSKCSPALAEFMSLNAGIQHRYADSNEVETVARLESQLRLPAIGASDLTGVDPLFEFVGDVDSWRVSNLRSNASLVFRSDPFQGLHTFWDIARSTAGKSHPTENSVGGMIGYLSFEAGLPLLGIPFDDNRIQPVPLIRFVYFANLVRSGKQSNDRRAIDQHHDLPFRSSHFAIDHRFDELTSSLSKQEYIKSVRQILHHIAEGDIYQANLTQRFALPTAIGGSELVERLNRENPAPFAAHLKYADSEVVSSSPERFLKVTGHSIESRPIKGTVARGTDRNSDRDACRQLLRSVKDRAELLMITDLVRNDLGRICEFGSVTVNRLRRPERYASVWHAVSCVRGRLRDTCDWHDALRAAFPAGSVTGAPKIRATQILLALEPVPRSVYCGTIGWVDEYGNADFSVAIRSTILKGGVAYVSGGGGIVADSDPNNEYRESLIKIAPIVKALQSEN